MESESRNWINPSESIPRISKNANFWANKLKLFRGKDSKISSNYPSFSKLLKSHVESTFFKDTWKPMHCIQGFRVSFVFRIFEERQLLNSKFSDPHDKIDTVFTQCCTAFQSVDVSPITGPPCSKFKGRTTIYNVDDNYSIYSTMIANYLIVEANFHKSLEIHSELSGQNNWALDFDINNFGDHCNV